ncbi:glycosyltransferase family 2 protein [Clostridium polynesiense]|uniref:glycosyltransferase family 2 protein n=1 Tax=Clostridium polynesiense TaxID=1325933 RepID=UPI00164ECF35|nr:glycosyltransferase family 2 protein [Clostridium polynesiense]
MKKKVSIMLTCYNCEEYINNAIKSVVVQEMPFNWELLIGDDGSSDSTVSIINGWIEKYPENIKLFVMKRDVNTKKDGKRAARNRANLLEKSTGEYLIYLDGDDCFRGNEKIKRQVQILDKPENIDCSCVAHNILANDLSEKRKYPLMENRLREGRVDSRKYWKELYFHTNTILFRSICKEKMLDEKYRDYLNDNFITYIILQYGKIYYLDKLWAQYNLTGEGLWTGKKRVYGCFRNMILYDLEININKMLKKEAFIRHLYDFRYIFKNYSQEDKDSVAVLVQNIPSELFHFTWLLYKFGGELDSQERVEKKRLELKVKLVFNFNRLIHIPKKIQLLLRKRR